VRRFGAATPQRSFRHGSMLCCAASFAPDVHPKRLKNLIANNRSLACIDGGESVSQSLLKNNVFSTFLDRNPPFELRRKMSAPISLPGEVRTPS
jgi:hypothetical protein